MFRIELPSKWVLTGEHTVLRGGAALAFPYPKFKLTLTYRDSGRFSLTPNPFQSQIRSLMQRALEWLKAPPDLLQTGEVEILSEIPIGSGLGSSAALCAAIARLALWRTDAPEGLWIPLATHLEDVFHGKSSGMDVSVMIAGRPVYFTMKEGPCSLELPIEPCFELFDSGIRGNTRDCIERVKHWQERFPHLKNSLDDQMKAATEKAREGLLGFGKDPHRSSQQLKEAMDAAQGCFETWGLTTPELMTQKFDLLRQGAVSVKLTGAGLGGFWAVLWPSKAAHP